MRERNSNREINMEQNDETEIEEEDLEPTDHIERNDDPDEEDTDEGYVCGRAEMRPAGNYRTVGSDNHFLRTRREDDPGCGEMRR
jgi:hypothetical protein